MTNDNDLLRLSDLVRLCASSMHLLAEARCRDGASGEAMGLAIQLEEIAFEMRRLAKEDRAEPAAASARHA